MSKNIAISDEVYEALKREKGDRSFSEVIAKYLETERRLADVTGQQVLHPDSHTEAKEAIRELSQGTVERLETNDL